MSRATSARALRRAVSSAVSSVLAGFESLEQRQFLSAVTLSGTGGDDVLVARRSSDQTEIHLWLNTNPDTTAPTHEYSRNDTTAFQFNALGGNDKLTLDASSGTPFHDNVLAFDGSAGTDTFEVVHHASSASRVSYFPSESDADAGTVLTGRRASSFDAVESVLASNVTTLTLTTPNVNDDLRIDSPASQSSRVRESGLVSGNTVFTPLTFSATKTLVVDTASNDGDTPGTDIIKVEGSGLTSIAPRASTTDPAVATDLRPVTGAGTNTLRLSAGTLSLSAGSTIDSGQTLDVIADAGTLSLTATQYLKSLTINNNGQAVLPKVALASSTTSASPHKVLVLNALTIDIASGATGTLDLADNAMIVRNGVAATLESLVHRALNEATGPAWGGAGITSSVAAASDLLSAVGLVRPADATSPIDPPDSSGQTLSGTDVLLKFTYFGDSNLDGVVNDEDYDAIDANFNTAVGHWVNGDFTYDGTIDGTDYFLIDNANGQAPHVRPTFTVSGNTSVNEGSSYTLTATASTGTGIPVISAWSVYWGDGSHSVHPNDGTPITHTYADDGGPYTIQVFAKGPDFNYTAGSTTVTVNNVAPTPSITGASSVNEGSTYTLNLGSSDPGDDQPTVWIVDWGDDSVSVLNGDSQQALHDYAVEGNYTINIDLHDEDATLTLPPRNLVVSDVAPSLTVTGPSSVAEGATYVLNLAYSDAANDAITWTVNWGDGSSAETIEGDSLAATHNFLGVAGTSHSITVTATDDANRSYQPITVPVTLGPTGTRKYNLSPDGQSTGDVLIRGTIDRVDRTSPAFWVQGQTPEAILEAFLKSYHEPGYPQNEIQIFPGPTRASQIQPYSAVFPRDLNASSGPSFRIIRQSGSAATGYEMRVQLLAPDGVVDAGWTWRLSPQPLVSVVRIQHGSEDRNRPAIFKVVSAGGGFDLRVPYTTSGVAIRGEQTAIEAAGSCTVPFVSAHNADYIDDQAPLLSDSQIASFYRSSDSTLLYFTPTNDCYDEVGGETLEVSLGADPAVPPTYAVANAGAAQAKPKNLSIELIPPSDLKTIPKAEFDNVNQWLQQFAIGNQASVELQRIAQLYPDLVFYYIDHAHRLILAGQVQRGREILEWALGLVGLVNRITFTNAQDPSVQPPVIRIQATSKEKVPADLPQNGVRRFSQRNNANDHLQSHWEGLPRARDEKDLSPPTENSAYLIITPLKAGRTIDGYFPSIAVTERFGTLNEEEFTQTHGLWRRQVHLRIVEN